MVSKKFILALKSWKIMLLVIVILLSILSITINSLNLGSDFVGGVKIEAELEHPANSSQELDSIKTILENRLNGLGLKDIKVRAWGNRFIVVEMARATPEQERDIENAIMQQARFIERIDGKLAIKGDEITIDTSGRGSMVFSEGNGWGWSVAVRHNKEGAERFGEAAKGKFGRPVDDFMDPPENSAILFTENTYKIMQTTTSFKTERGQDIAFHNIDNGIYIIETRCQIPIIKLNTLSENKTNEENQTNESKSYDLNDLKEQLEKLKNKNINKIIIAENDRESIDITVENFIAEQGFKIIKIPRDKKLLGEWIKELTGLQSFPRLQISSTGQPIYDARITGSAATKQEAEKELRFTQVLLTSGNLPIKILPICGTPQGEKGQCGGKITTFDARLGTMFLNFSLIGGLLAIIGVSLFITVRYKKILFVLPIMLTCLSEVIIILGFASAIHWELDLLAVAGIIIAIGTGVDNQIVIIDETLKRGKKKEIISIVERIKAAFFIIFASGFTTIAAMIALTLIGAGMLKGFAFTTIVGILIGILITRPAFAKIIEILLK